MVSRSLAFQEALWSSHLDLLAPYDDDAGEPLFGLKVREEHDVSAMKLRRTERRGRSYRIEITASLRTRYSATPPG